MNGYAGKILRLDLTNRKISTIPTSDYAQWGGGHGMGSAIFFDLVKDKTIDGFDPGNVVTIMTSPLCGTLVPAAGGRTEVQGIGVQSSPIGWFTRSNFGGRFSSQLKYAGWDGIVLEGRAPEPVWVDIRDGEVRIRDCAGLGLWGKDTWDCQQTIWDDVAGNGNYGDWLEPRGAQGGRTTQRPAVLAIGPGGENLSRLGCLIHDASNSSGQGGFGGVWGSKQLKAISVIGTGGIHVHDPKALLKARIWQKQHYAFNEADLENIKPAPIYLLAGIDHKAIPYPAAFFTKGRPKGGQRPQACVGCHSGCRARYDDALGNEATCLLALFYPAGKDGDIQRKASDLCNKYGLNGHELNAGLAYVHGLYVSGDLGPGKAIDCPLDFEDYGSLAFVEQYVKAIAYRNDGLGNPHAFGDAIAEGFVRAADKWGRLDGDSGDLKTGRLSFPYWGIPMHNDPRTALEWGYGSILGDRDANEHDFAQLSVESIKTAMSLSATQLTAGEITRIFTGKMEPFQGDQRMLDYSTANMYSEHIAKLVSWHRYYTRYYKQSMLFCDWRWPDFVNHHAPDGVGSSGEAEPKFINAVTGKTASFLDGIETGRKIWNLDHAIWTLQGRHRDMVHFAEYIYTLPGGSGLHPGMKDGKWDYLRTEPRHIDKERFEEFKTRFYELQGWDTASGYPTKSTLADLGLGYVADELQTQGKLGA